MEGDKPSGRPVQVRIIPPAPVVIATLGWSFCLGQQPNHMYIIG